MSQFTTHKYDIIRKVIETDYLKSLNNHAITLVAEGKMNLRDGQVHGTPGINGDPLMNRLLLHLKPMVESNTGLSLLPTYSYLRIYKHGDILERHFDRPACEISVTLNLGLGANYPWPIWIEGPLGVASVELNPGDGMIYRGCDCEHWRNAFDGHYCTQVFLHYVNKNGPNAEWIYDKKERLEL